MHIGDRENFTLELFLERIDHRDDILLLSMSLSTSESQFYDLERDR